MTNMPSVWFHGVQVSLKYDQYSWSSDSCELWTDFFFLQAFCQTSISVYFHHKT